MLCDFCDFCATFIHHPLWNLNKESSSSSSSRWNEYNGACTYLKIPRNSLPFVVVGDAAVKRLTGKIIFIQRRQEHWKGARPSVSVVVSLHFLRLVGLMIMSLQYSTFSSLHNDQFIKLFYFREYPVIMHCVYEMYLVFAWLTANEDELCSWGKVEWRGGAGYFNDIGLSSK